MAASKDTQSNPFIRQLASSDKRIRDRALSSLRTYLQRKTAFTSLELRKLWKGLYYCMWMSDKPRNQQLLAQDLADLVNVVASVNFIGFVETFWVTIAAEWGNIDRLRMDKFLYLIRCYVNTGFAWLQRHDWGQEKMLNEYLKVLEQTPLNARDAKIPNGLRYHVIDIYVDELDKVDTASQAPVEQLLAPLRSLRKSTPTKTVREKIDEALDDERLKDWPARGDIDVSDEDAEDDAREEDAEEADETVNKARSQHKRKGATRQMVETADNFDGFGD